MSNSNSEEPDLLTPVVAAEQLTHDIYKAMQIPYLSERHDAIKDLIHSREQEIVQKCIEALPEKLSENNKLGKPLGGSAFEKARIWNLAIDQATAALKQVEL